MGSFFSAIDAIAPWCWPSIAASVLLLCGIKRTRWRLADRTRNALQWVGIAMLVWPMLFVVAFSNRSATTLANADAGVFALGVVGLMAAYVRRPAIGDQKFAGMFLVGGLFASYGGWYLIGDFVLPRTLADGTVTMMSQDRGPRGHRSYYIWIDSGRFSTTEEIYDRFKEGVRIHAEMGAGSNTVLRATPL
jgi:hypothetical protein